MIAHGDADPPVAHGDDALFRAAARILARHHHPEWRPEDDAEFDAWGNGYNRGWRHGFQCGRADDE